MGICAQESKVGFKTQQTLMMETQGELLQTRKAELMLQLNHGFSCDPGTRKCSRKLTLRMYLLP